DVMSFSTIASPRGLRPRYRRKVSLKRSAQRSNFSGEIEADFLSSSALRLDVFGDGGRLRNHDSIGLQAVDMEPDRLANFVLDRRNRVADATQPGKSRHIGRIIAVGSVDDDT